MDEKTRCREAGIIIRQEIHQILIHKNSEISLSVVAYYYRKCYKRQYEMFVSTKLSNFIRFVYGFLLKLFFFSS